MRPMGTPAASRSASALFCTAPQAVSRASRPLAPARCFKSRPRCALTPSAPRLRHRSQLPTVGPCCAGPSHSPATTSFLAISAPVVRPEGGLAVNAELASSVALRSDSPAEPRFLRSLLFTFLRIMTGNLPQDVQQHSSSIVQPAAGKLPKPASQLVDSHSVSRRCASSSVPVNLCYPLPIIVFRICYCRVSAHGRHLCLSEV